MDKHDEHHHERDSASSGAWENFFTENMDAKAFARHLFGLIPSSPRCRFCNAPFHGVGAPVMRVLGKRRSKMNPNYCNVCERFAVKNPGGVEMDMAMLFADIRGSTNLAEGMRPVEFRQLIDRFYTTSSKLLVKADALIDKLVGDEVTAFFVEGLAGEAYVRSAVQAAQDLLRATGHADAGGPWVPVGVGVHFGNAFFGSVGSPDGLVEVTALGDPVNTAARLASEAGPGEVIVSEEAMAAAGLPSHRMEARSLNLKGKSEAVDVRVLHVDSALQ